MGKLNLPPAHGETMTRENKKKKDSKLSSIELHKVYKVMKCATIGNDKYCQKRKWSNLHFGISNDKKSVDRETE